MHLDSWMHEGQPEGSRQVHVFISLMQSDRMRSKFLKQALDKPIPPGKLS